MLALGYGILPAQSIWNRLIEGIGESIKNYAGDKIRRDEEERWRREQQMSAGGGTVIYPPSNPDQWNTSEWNDAMNVYNAPDTSPGAISEPLMWGSEPNDSNTRDSSINVPQNIGVMRSSVMTTDLNAVSAKQLYGFPNMAISPAPAYAPAPQTMPAADIPVSGVNPGLMYYVELIQPNGATSRVDVSRGFRSGERIRLHFQSNVNGRLVIMQQVDDGPVQPLYPDSRVNGGDNQIRAGVDTVIPQGNAWMRFDDNPGWIKLMVFLTTDSWYDALRPQLADFSTGSRDNQRIIDAQFARAASRSRSLILEVDNTGVQPANYAVLPSGDSIYVEIVLNHQP